MTASYSDFDAAKADGAISRGWIPDWLPESATRLTEKHDLDTNSSAMIMQINKKDIDLLMEFCRDSNLGYRPRFLHNDFRRLRSSAKPLQCEDFSGLLSDNGELMLWRS